MNIHQISKENIVEQFKGGIDCGQVVLSQWAEDLGYEREELLRMAAGFGGGMFRGDTCGAVCAAIIAIGLRYGHSKLNDDETKGVFLSKVKEFQKLFTERCGSTICREMCGYDFSQPGQLSEALVSGALIKYCPTPVQTALNILDEIM